MVALSSLPDVRRVGGSVRASRPDIGDETRNYTSSHLKRLLPAFGERDPQAIKPADVQEWIGVQMADLKPSSLKRYVTTLRAVLDFADVDPNPARRVKLPRVEETVVEPPSGKDVATIIATAPPRWRLPLRVLAETGMRVGELRDLEWNDVDLAESRLRIRSGKTKAARRRVAVPALAMVAVRRSVPAGRPHGRAAGFPRLHPGCREERHGSDLQSCGDRALSPHDLRHRFAS